MNYNFIIIAYVIRLLNIYFVIITDLMTDFFRIVSGVFVNLY